jgi:hypothetical protein
VTAASRQAFAGRRLWVITAASLLLASLWVVWVVRFGPWVAHNDFAVMRVSLERALDGHIPTVGTYSRLGVYHPGPLREWVFVVPYALGGGRAATLPATALVLNAAWLLACGWLAVRCGAGGCRIALFAGATLLVVGLGQNLASPWNPHLAILPLYVACWSVTLLAREGDRELSVALLAVVATSFAGQLHASALPVAGTLLAWAVLFPIVRAWPRWSVRPCLPLLLGLVLWSGVLVDLRKLGSSNLVDLAQTGAISTLGVGDALGLVSRLLWPPTGATGLSIRPSAASLVGFSRVWAVVLVAGLVGTAWWAYRSGNRSRQLPRDATPPASDVETEAVDPAVHVELETVWRGAVVALATLTISVLTIASFAPPPFRYLFGPLQAVAVFALAVMACVPIGILVRRAPQRTAAAASTAGLTLLACVCVAVFVFVPVDDHESAARRELGVEPAVLQFLEAHPDWQTVEVVGLDMLGASAQDEVAVVAYRAGRDVRSAQFGLHLQPPDGTEPVLAVAMGPSFECLIAESAAQPVLSGLVGASPIGVFGLEADAARRSACLGAG